MKILQVYKTYLSESMGGVEQTMAHLAEGTTLLGAQHRILCLSPKADFSHFSNSSAEVFRYKQLFDIASTGFSFSAIKGFRELVKWADIIHYHYPWPFGDVLHFLGNVTQATLVTYHSDIVRQQFLLKCYRPLQQAFLKQMHAIVATSPNYVKSSAVLSQYANKTHVIPLGLAQKNYPLPTAEKLAFWRQKLPERFFLFVGVLRYYKGLHTLLAAAEKIAFPIIIVGSGPLQTEIQNIIKNKSLSHIQCLGALPDEDKIALLSLCTAFVFPSHLRSEAFGLSLVEAAMFAKPMISCEIGTGTSYINLDQHTGLVVPPCKPDELAQAMAHLWQNPTLAQQFGQQAQQRYLSLFTAQQMCDQYYRLYCQLNAPISC